MPLALVAAIGVAAVTVISARSDDGGRHDTARVFSEGDDESQEKDCADGKRSARFTELAELVGTDLAGLKAALGEGQTLAQIAESNGVEVQDVIDALVERANGRIDAAVEAGKLTATEAETKKSEAASKDRGLGQQRVRQAEIPELGQGSLEGPWSRTRQRPGCRLSGDPPEQGAGRPVRTPCLSVNEPEQHVASQIQPPFSALQSMRWTDGHRLERIDE